MWCVALITTIHALFLWGETLGPGVAVGNIDDQVGKGLASFYYSRVHDLSQQWPTASTYSTLHPLIYLFM